MMERTGVIYADMGPDCVMPQFMNLNYLASNTKSCWKIKQESWRSSDWPLTWTQTEQNTNLRHQTPSFKPHTKCLIKKKIVCGSSEYCPKYRATDSRKKEKVWTKGLFVSFRMPFCITAYLKASYIPDVLDWPRTPHPPHTHTHIAGHPHPRLFSPSPSTTIISQEPWKTGNIPKPLKTPND